jgi:hypothetical protein
MLAKARRNLTVRNSTDVSEEDVASIFRVE